MEGREGTAGGIRQVVVSLSERDVRVRVAVHRAPPSYAPVV
jgi:hypothetical protein